VARRALGPASLAAVQAVRAALTPADTALLVACSGGADSLALAVATREVAERSGRPYAALVVDHGLQAGSAGVAGRAAATLADLGYRDVAVVRVAVDLAAGQGLEASARTARYAALDAAARAGLPLTGPPEAGGRTSAPATVLLGHTRDDQAETVLLGLLRGSGTRSLAGMAPRTGAYLRPLLDLTRATTEQVCRERALVPHEDPHNADPAYARSRVRHRVLPLLEAELGPGTAAALARTAFLARDDADLLDELAAAADPGTATLGCDELGALPPALRRRVLRRWISRESGSGPSAGDLTLAHVRAVEQLLEDWHGQRGVPVPGGAVARRDGRLLWQAVGRG